MINLRQPDNLYGLDQLHGVNSAIGATGIVVIAGMS